MRFLCISILMFLMNAAIGQQSATSKVMADFMDKRFGLFIHWGPITLRGTEIGWSRGEQVATADYDNLYKEFNPVLFDANAWVKTAKDAGMKYLVITAKHHDGFCLWPTAFSNYNIMATPYKRDIVGELAKACKKQGISFCIYCTVLDWHDDDYLIHRMGKDTTGNMPRFVQRMKNQLQELITRYKPEMLWFDGYWETPWTSAYGRDVYDYIKKIDSNILVNNRLGKDYSSLSAKDAVGDFMTPEQTIGQLNMNEPWESCMTICEQWAWKPNDKMKSLKQCIQTLAKSACGNGNLLFNVGPMMDGRIEARQTQRLKEIGDWLKQNGQSIYTTKGGPFIPNDVYGSTRKRNQIFIHVFERKHDTLILAPIPLLIIKKAYLMDGQPIAFKQDVKGITIALPSKMPDENDTVIILEADQDVEKIAVIK